jgi:hypothetical protein
MSIVRWILAAALLAAIAAAFGLGRRAHAGSRSHTISARSLLAECSMDLRQNPAVFVCPGGCTVRLYNNPDRARAPIIEISPECSALRQAQGRPLR